MLALNEQAIESTRRTARGEQGRLCVGVTPTGPFHPFVPRVIRAFREAFPLVSLTLEECLSPELLIRLRNEQMDAAFLRTPMAEPEDLVVDSLLEEPMVMALPSAHALAQNDGDDAALSLKDLAGETFIVYARQRGPGLYDATTAACLEAGFSPRLGQEAPRITSALSLVAAGLGISAVPASMQRMIMEIHFNRPDFSFLTGWDPAISAMLFVGATGGILATAGVVPELALAIYASVIQCRFEKAKELQVHLIRLFDAMLNAGEFPSGFRAGAPPQRRKFY